MAPPSEVEGAAGIPGAVVGVGVIADANAGQPNASGNNPKGGRRQGRRGGGRNSG